MSGLLTPRFAFTWMASLFQGLAFFLFVHFPGYLKELGATEFQIGIVIASTAVSALAIRPQLGRAIDRRGRRPVFLIGNALNVLVLASYLTVDSIGPWLFVVRVTHGISVGMVFAATIAYAADLIPEERRTQGLALFGVSGLLPVALGGVIGDVVTTRWDFDALFLTALGFGILGLVFALPLREVAPPVLDGVTISFLRPLIQRDLLPLWWMTLVFAFALSGYFVFLRTFVDVTGIGSVGAFFAAYAATAIFLRITLGWLPDRVGQKRVLYPAITLFAGGFIVLAVAGSAGMVTLAGAMCGAGHGYVFPIMYSLAFGRARASDRGSASAIFTGVFDLGNLVGGPVLGLLIVLVGYSQMFVAAAAWVVLGTIAFAVWDGDAGRRRRTRTTPVSLG
jgi:MFS family permease